MSYVDMDLRDLRTDTGPRYHLYGWIAAVLMFGLGDLVTTFVGIEYLGAVEGNALPLVVIEAVGLYALVALKAAAFAAFWILFQNGPPLYRTGIPIGLTLLGSAVVGWNAALLLVASGVL